ncbi:MAG: chemotaxis protein CheC [Thermaerobacter sp.]|nr:chemotaxis protein CheC [Thermaerobacter sp.]
MADTTNVPSAALEDAFRRGLASAGTVLSTMIGRDITLHSPYLGFTPINRVPELVGGPEAPVVAIYVGVSGSLVGHAVLLFESECARHLVRLILEEEVPDILAPLPQSLVGEVGNVAVSSFLNSLADYTGLKIVPSPPQVVFDMAGAVLSGILALVAASSEEVLVVEAGFRQQQEALQGFFLLLPEASSLDTLLTALHRGRDR